MLPAQAFFHPIERSEDAKDPAPRTIWIGQDAKPASRVSFCQQLTPTLVCNSAGQQHANGALGILRVIIAVADPAGPASLLSRLFGWNTVPPQGYGSSTSAGLAQVDNLTLRPLQAAFGREASVADGCNAWMAALTRRRAPPAAALAAGCLPHTHRPAGIVVPASEPGSTTPVPQD